MKNYKNYLLIALGIIISSTLFSITNVKAINEMAVQDVAVKNDWALQKLLHVTVDGNAATVRANQQWEYQIRDFDSNNDFSGMGDAKWELVAISSGFGSRQVAVFKRAK